MLTIPLSLFGAILGLLITGNDFGFMAFCGIISLSGIVVRNAIILIDHTNELIRKGSDIPTAAWEAGSAGYGRSFSQPMAAAIGVLPMILSGSPLWSPLASVIAFGVVWSMVISTLSIPVLYTVTIEPKDKKDIISTKSRNKVEIMFLSKILICCCLFGGNSRAANSITERQSLSLEDAVGTCPAE